MPATDKTVDELLAEHACSVEALRQHLSAEELFDPDGRHDGLWLLRFLLSSKGSGETACAGQRSAAA